MQNAVEGLADILRSHIRTEDFTPCLGCVALADVADWKPVHGNGGTQVKMHLLTVDAIFTPLGEGAACKLYKTTWKLKRMAIAPTISSFRVFQTPRSAASYKIAKQNNSTPGCRIH